LTATAFCLLVNLEKKLKKRTATASWAIRYVGVFFFLDAPWFEFGWLQVTSKSKSMYIKYKYKSKYHISTVISIHYIHATYLELGDARYYHIDTRYTHITYRIYV
jgi:hypothetical protein